MYISSHLTIFSEVILYLFLLGHFQSIGSRIHLKRTHFHYVLSDIMCYIIVILIFKLKKIINAIRLFNFFIYLFIYLFFFLNVLVLNLFYTKKCFLFSNSVGKHGVWQPWRIVSIIFLFTNWTRGHKNYINWNWMSLLNLNDYSFILKSSIFTLVYFKASIKSETAES